MLRSQASFTDRTRDTGLTESSLGALFGRFQSIINKLRANKANGVHLVSDHEQALKRFSVSSRPQRSLHRRLPQAEQSQKGTSGGSYDSFKHNSSTFTKGKPKTRLFRKALKDYQRENKKRDKAFFTEMERSYSKRSSSSSSSSSLSDEEIVIKKGKDKDDSASFCFMAFGDKPKSHSHHSQRSRKSVYSMDLEDKDGKGSPGNSDVKTMKRYLPMNKKSLNYLKRTIRS
ncbi:hypothetical protein GUJ93_ZPchr0005g15875 [Zizania palustris]|uniref:Uncharacterized protein n=1 Tax=Zizania palustris TaxID=103762 RepID=A0A8J5W114_ZIZPA|nr:hypothetical protein GUJ93_ZPchr0005g15875 [Zizania palustris]